MSGLLIDLKHAWRGLAKAPLFTAAVALTLALGIGLDSAMLAVFDRLLLRPLPFEDLDTLVGVYEADTQLGWTNNVLSAPNFVDFQRQATEFEAMAAHVYTTVNMSDEGETIRVRAGRVSHTFFPSTTSRGTLSLGWSCRSRTCSRMALRMSALLLRFTASVSGKRSPTRCLSSLRSNCKRSAAPSAVG